MYALRIPLRLGDAMPHNTPARPQPDGDTPQHAIIYSFDMTRTQGPSESKPGVRMNEKYTI